MQMVGVIGIGQEVDVLGGAYHLVRRQGASADQCRCDTQANERGERLLDLLNQS